MCDDLIWWWQILHDPSLNGVPLTYFDSLPEPDITVVTDASDVGLCALVPSRRLSLTYRFGPAERDLVAAFKRAGDNEFDINYRELLACAFAVFVWGASWRPSTGSARPVYVHFRVDNTSAISWQSKMSSRNQRAQLAPERMRTIVRTPLLRLAHRERQEHGSRRGIPSMAERHLRQHISEADGRLDPIHPTGEHRRSRTRLAHLLRERSVADSSFQLYKRGFDYWKRWARARGIPWRLNVPLT